MKLEGPVFPIPPSYNDSNRIDVGMVHHYIDFLIDNNARTIMTTAGTSQFNLLSNAEVLMLNKCCSRFCGTKILGIPDFNVRDASRIIELHNAEFVDDGATYLMLLFPERYYRDREVVEYFDQLADTSKFPCFIHGMFMRKGSGGFYNYSASLINQICQHKNIVGVKEESMDFGTAYDVCSNLDEDVYTIVAGGSMKRFNLLRPTNADTWLVGIGSLFPEVELEFNRIYDLDLIHDFENPFFNTFMKIGWHLAMREGMMQMGLLSRYTRRPFPYVTTEQRKEITETIQDIQYKCVSQSS